MKAKFNIRFNVRIQYSPHSGDARVNDLTTWATQRAQHFFSHGIFRLFSDGRLILGGEKNLKTVVFQVPLEPKDINAVRILAPELLISRDPPEKVPNVATCLEVAKIPDQRYGQILPCEDFLILDTTERCLCLKSQRTVRRKVDIKNPTFLGFDI
ncbi:MAG: hypothetical protein Q8P86_03210 [bacterium]|nr:hypothetical protein [bacterium]